MNWLLPRDSLREVIFGPTVWIVFFIVAYVWVGTGCTFAPDTLVGWVVGCDAALIWTAIGAAAILVVGAIAAILHLREARKAGAHPPKPRKDQRNFLSLSSLCLIGMSLLGVVWVTSALFLVPACEGGAS